MKAVTLMNSTVSKLALSLVFAASLAACGGGDSAPATPAVLAGPLSVPISKTTAPAAIAALVAAKNFTFSSGIAALGTTGPTTLSFSAPAAGSTAVPLTMTSGGVTKKGTLTFGSCIFTFTVEETGKPIDPPLVYTIPTSACNLGVNTTNAAANNSTVNRELTFTFFDNESGPVWLGVLVRADGTILIDDQIMGKGTLTVTTGASS